MAHYEKTLDSTRIYEGKIINVRKDRVELENGRTSSREVVEHPGGVCVLPITDDGNVILVRQYRYPYASEVLEAPAGKMDHGHEIPLECGKRELEEETGHSAAEYIPLGELYPSPGYVDEIIHLFAAKGLIATAQNLDEDEFLSLETYPMKTAVQMILDGTIKDAKTQAVILKAFLLNLDAANK